MNSLDNEGFFLTEHGYAFYFPNSTHKIGSVLGYGSVLIELSELTEKLQEFQLLLQTYKAQSDLVNDFTKYHDEYMRFFRDNLAHFAPLIAEDWLDFILYKGLKNHFEKVNGKLTYAQVTLDLTHDLSTLSHLATRLLQILSDEDISQEDEQFFIRTFKHQEMKVRFEKSDVTGRADLLFLVEDFHSFIALEAHALQKWKYTVKKCRNCCEWFIPNKSDTLNCDRISPQYPDKTCKDAAKHIQRLKRENANESAKIYKSLYTIMLNKYNAAKDIGDSKLSEELRKELYDVFMPSANQWKLDIKAAVKTEQEYLEWLNSHKRKKDR